MLAQMWFSTSCPFPIYSDQKPRPSQIYDPCIAPTMPMVTRSKIVSLKKNIYTFDVSDLHNKEQKDLTEAFSSSRWVQVMKDEIMAFIKNHTWILVPPDPTKNVVCNKWVFKVRRNSNGSHKDTKQG